ncbi:c-type cytochrome [Stieleria sp. JC731]|uniref:c-type cytochrome n=1 Tax=Pirellulaceae TaxID=2691357 RepID=UPI001E5FAED6|nr:c-type cytochrome [Stieleria sp. JC731]MCC9603256.1 c-type cytochrome [Stieleria sp. JC731]
MDAPLLKRAALAIALLAASTDASAQQNNAPKIFLDKSPRIVAYQLGRLDDTRLLMVERSTDDPKYIPVYEAITLRSAMTSGVREEAFNALVKLRDTTFTTELLSAITGIKSSDSESKRLVNLLGKTLLDQPPEELNGQKEQLIELVGNSDAMKSAVAMAALIVAGQQEDIDILCRDSDSAINARLSAVALLPSDSLQNAQREFAVSQLQSPSITVRRAAISALATIPGEPHNTFNLLIGLVDNADLRVSACRGLLRLPTQSFDAAASAQAASVLVAFAEQTEPANRTTDGFIDAMRSVDRLLTVVEPNAAKALRRRLREVAVRVVRIGTVEEEMRYDVPYFAVEAGRPVQILLENHDLMPHNLVVTQPGTLKSVAMAGLTAGPEGTDGLPYVPQSTNILAASDLIAPDKSARITLTAPKTPGEYPYVCTFPQHWYRMYGVMIVVEDLDAWNQNPTEPVNPLGSNRSFVKAWSIDDFRDNLGDGLAGRSASIGEKIFNEASCVGCHKVKGSGGVVGPELTDVYARWKQDDMAILREILEPSHKIDSKYAMQTVLTTEGKTYSGIVLDENDDILTMVSSPDDKEPIVIQQDDIELTKRSATSMMPKALLDQYTKEEILELMAYLKSVSP